MSYAPYKSGLPRFLQQSHSRFSTSAMAGSADYTYATSPMTSAQTPLSMSYGAESTPTYDNSSYPSGVGSAVTDVSSKSSPALLPSPLGITMPQFPSFYYPPQRAQGIVYNQRMFGFHRYPPVFGKYFGRQGPRRGFRMPPPTARRFQGPVRMPAVVKSIFCDVCKIRCAGESQYQSHLRGQRHQKRAKMVSQVSGTVAVSKKKKKQTSPSNSNSLFCDVCQIYCSSAGNMADHQAGTKHNRMLKMRDRKGGGAAANDDESTVDEKDLQELTELEGAVVPAETVASAATTAEVDVNVTVASAELPTHGPSAPTDQKPAVGNTANAEGETQLDASNDNSVLHFVKNDDRHSYYCTVCSCYVPDAAGRASHLAGRRHRKNQLLLTKGSLSSTDAVLQNSSLNSADDVAADGEHDGGSEQIVSDTDELWESVNCSPGITMLVRPLTLAEMTSRLPANAAKALQKLKATDEMLRIMTDLQAFVFAVFMKMNEACDEMNQAFPVLQFVGPYTKEVHLFDDFHEELLVISRNPVTEDSWANILYTFEKEAKICDPEQKFVVDKSRLSENVLVFCTTEDARFDVTIRMIEGKSDVLNLDIPESQVLLDLRHYNWFKLAVGPPQAELIRILRFIRNRMPYMSQLDEFTWEVLVVCATQEKWFDYDGMALFWLFCERFAVGDVLLEYANELKDPCFPDMDLNLLGNLTPDGRKRMRTLFRACLLNLSSGLLPDVLQFSVDLETDSSPSEEQTSPQPEEGWCQKLEPDVLDGVVATAADALSSQLPESTMSSNDDEGASHSVDQSKDDEFSEPALKKDRQD